MSIAQKWAASDDLDDLLCAARKGSLTALSLLLEGCRDYLLLVANQELGRDLQAKVGASDLVQETVFKANRAFEDFTGKSDAEFLGWLRAILLNNLLTERRRYSCTIRRDISRETSWNSDSQLRQVVANLPANGESPSQTILAQEQDRSLEAMLELLPDDYRQVIYLRYWEGHTFTKIGQLMGRSPAATRKLWLRAVERLGMEGGFEALGQ